MANYLDIKTALTGGGANALDGVDGAVCNDGDAAVVLAAGVAYFFLLDADSGAGEASPDVIAPDSNPSNKRWILQKAYLDTASNAVAAAMTDTEKPLVAGNLDQALALYLASGYFLQGGTDKMQFVAGRLEIQNDGGTIKHRFVSHSGSSGAASPFIDANVLVDSTTTWNTTQTVDAATDFQAGAGIQSGSTHYILLDVPAGVADADPIVVLDNAYCSAAGGGPHTVLGTTESSIIASVGPRRRIRFGFFTSTGAAWHINTTNIGAGKIIYVPFWAFWKKN